MADTIYIPSIIEATRQFVMAYKSNDLKKMTDIRNYWKAQENAMNISGTGDEFHNAAVELTRNDFYSDACDIISIGLLRYSKNTDLLGDMLAYGLHCKPIDGNEMKQFFKKLESINKRYWTWRAYQFSFDYLMEYLKYVDTIEEEETVKEDILNIVEAFKNHFNYLNDKSDREKAFMMECDYYRLLGEDDRSKEALVEATKALPGKCVQCAFRLADVYFEEGDYKNSAYFSRMALELKEDQDSINKGYAYFILAMAEEKNSRDDGSITDVAKVKKIFNYYSAAYEYFKDDITRGRTCTSIKKQVKILERLTNVDSDIDFNAGIDSSNFMELIQALQKEN